MRRAPDAPPTPWPGPLRPPTLFMHLTRPRTARWIPVAAALAAALVGVINVASALTPNIRWRGHLLLALEPVQAMRMFHAFALPAGVALLVVSPYLLKRRRRAWQAAILLMLVLGGLDLLKGLDVEESVLTWATGAVLLRAGPAFDVEHDPISLRSAIWRLPVLAGLGVAVAAVAASATQGRPSWSSVGRETWALLAWHVPIHLHHHFRWLALSVHLVEVGTALAMAYVVFRPLAGPASLPGATARRAAADLVPAHGTDTLSFFKLRADQRYFFSADRSAFVGYTIENGVLLLSGDPVGPDAALPALLSELRLFTGARGLKLGAVGASERLRPLYASLGLRTMYLGDEAILELEGFSLEGRAIRKVRQSVSRLTKAGFTAELHRVSDLSAESTHEVALVLQPRARGRSGAGILDGDGLDRGGVRDRDTLVLLARDESGSGPPGPRRAAFRPLLRALRDVAVVHAP